MIDSQAELDALRVKVTLLQHELEQVQGRLRRRLTDSADMLEVGLSALRKETCTPRVQVMLERAEVVISDLRKEVAAAA